MSGGASEEGQENEAGRGGRRSHAQRVYEELRALLLRGELPAGERLVEQQLAAQFDTSRTPVREALRRLEGDGHLERDRSGGMRPATPSVRSMRELYEVRIALEDVSARRAARHGDPAIVDVVLEEWRTMAAGNAAAGPAPPGPDFVHADEGFHESIARAGGNAEMLRLLREINGRIRVVRIHDFTIPERITATIAEHLEIAEAIRDGDAEAAAAFMHAHVQRSALVVRERVGAALARMFDAP